ncbi:hypothetical protein AB1Y20_022019 [Prymnesium parvum]|uniref:Uncharacterized protein n=1 Tax=Prymnesium parvum TaxID=97485 RepID=A0AB34JGP0_PRYPA
MMVLLATLPLPLLLPPPTQPTRLIAHAAELVLRSKLRECGAVAVHVDGRPSDLLQGRVFGVRVAGRSWCTPQRLSCRSLEVEVGRTSLDLPQLVQTARIQLREPALGAARVLFSPRDWDNFLHHPLLVDALRRRRRRAAAGEWEFVRGASFDRAAGCVRFHARCGGRAVVCVLSQPAGRVKVKCSLAEEEGARVSGSELEAMAAGLEEFFTGLRMDLDGCLLSFRSMAIVREPPRALRETRSTPGLLLELTLDVRVERFPSPALNI